MPRFRYNRGSRQRHVAIRGALRMFGASNYSVWTDDDFNLENLRIGQNPPSARNNASPRSLHRVQEEILRVQEEIVPVREIVSVPDPTIAPMVEAEVTVGEVPDQDPIPEDFVLNAEHMEVRKLMECPVCFNVILPPIILCCSGHSVCNDCKIRLSTCPTCKGPFTATRNIFAEQLMDRCELLCKNGDKGCRVMLPGRELAKHQKSCEFGGLVRAGPSADV